MPSVFSSLSSLFFLFFFLYPPTDAWPTGAPVCRFDPSVGHGGKSQDPTSNPFDVIVKQGIRVQHCVKVGESYNVSIQDPVHLTLYRGFIFKLRPSSGTIDRIISQNVKFMYQCGSARGITHSSSRLRRRIEFTWTAGSGTQHYDYAIVMSKSSFYSHLTGSIQQCDQRRSTTTPSSTGLTDWESSNNGMDTCAQACAKCASVQCSTDTSTVLVGPPGGTSQGIPGPPPFSRTPPPENCVEKWMWNHVERRWDFNKCPS